MQLKYSKGVASWQFQNGVFYEKAFGIRFEIIENLRESNPRLWFLFSVFKTCFKSSFFYYG